jgi:hypothetical protein
VVSDGHQDTAQQLSAWALQQQQQQQEPIARSQRYTVVQQQAAPPVFVTVLQDFLVGQYRLEGRQADVAACAALAAVMAASLAPASWQSYSSMFGLFVRFCISSNVSFLPATRLTGVLWGQHLAEKGTVKASTAQPYFSVVNTIHQLVGHPKPCAANPALTAFRKGWERQQQPLVVEPALAGLALPPRLAYALYLALPSCNTVATLRPVLFSVLSYVLILRPASLLSVVWMRVSDNFLQYKPLHWKSARSLPADAPVLQFPVQSMPFLPAALSRFQQLRGPPGATFWSLRDEPAYTTPAAEQWFDAAVRLAPVELNYTLYSCRRGGASAAAAVGVPLHKLEALGGWAAGSSALRKRYMDHAVPADTHALMFFAALVHSAVASTQLFNT